MTGMSSLLEGPREATGVLQGANWLDPKIRSKMQILPFSLAKE